MSSKIVSLAGWLIFVPILHGERIPGRYIVELTTSPVAAQVPRGRMTSVAAATQRAKLLSEQAAVRSRLEQNQAQVLDGVSTVLNALFVAVDDSKATALASLPGVKKVYPVRTVRMYLDRAVMLHRVTDAWNVIGADKAGAGIKVAIIDSGIEPGHPAFQDSTLTQPEGFPKGGGESDFAFTNNKIVVARSYVNLLQYPDPDESPRDHIGHGTALAMTVAGVTNAGPRATITGVAPKAWLGVYKVFGTPGWNDGSNDAAIVKAIDDAVADGMDIINLSLGSDLAPRLADDVEVQAVEQATQAGVIVVAAAGNDGPGLNTMSSPATAPSVIAAGAVSNDRTFASSVDAPGAGTFVAYAGTGPTPASSVTAPLADVEALDGNGLACSALPTGSLTGKTALILRGSCYFETKLNNAAQSGAVGAIIYTAASAPDPFFFSAGAATLPAEMVSNSDGLTLKSQLATQPDLSVTLIFAVGFVPVKAKRLTDFTAAGPNVDGGIKPDLVAVGQDFYTATQTFDPNGSMHSSDGYVLVDGTSFSSPLVAGAAALIKSARPGLTVAQYRSLLINTTSDALTLAGDVPGIQQAGAGLLDASAALTATATAYPTSLGLGAGGSEAQFSRTLSLTNVGSAQETFTLAAQARSGQFAPVFSSPSVDLAPGASADVQVTWSASGLTPGAFEGIVTVSGAASGTQLRIPYWYASTANVPAHVTNLYSISTARRGSLQRNAILFRVTDSSGVTLTGVQPEVSVLAGGGVARSLTSYDSDVPGVFGLTVQLGFLAGSNTFRIQAGDVYTDVTITGQ